MKLIECHQGSPEWLKARLGIPTASEFDKIFTPTGKASTQAETYANTMVAEWLTGMPGEDYLGEWMQRGRELEAEARAFYRAFEATEEVREVGFIVRDDERSGASPDSLVGEKGGLEIKCPKPSTHIGYLLSNKVPTKYITQLQGQMWVAELEWVDFISYCPNIEPVLIRVKRDEPYILKLARAVGEFNKLVDEKKQVLIERGIKPAEAA